MRRKQRRARNLEQVRREHHQNEHTESMIRDRWEETNEQKPTLCKPERRRTMRRRVHRQDQKEARRLGLTMEEYWSRPIPF